MNFNSTDFRKIMGSFATGVTIVTTLGSKGNPYGVTVNSFTSVSLEPMLVLVCLGNHLTGLPLFLEQKFFAISILNQEQQHISEYFATSVPDRSKYLELRGEMTGAPIIRDCLGHLECSLSTCYPEGDHQILIGKVLGGELSSATTRPLLYFGGGYFGSKS